MSVKISQKSCKANILYTLFAPFTNIVDKNANAVSNWYLKENPKFRSMIREAVEERLNNGEKIDASGKDKGMQIKVEFLKNIFGDDYDSSRFFEAEGEAETKMKPIFTETGDFNFDIACEYMNEESYQNVILVEAIKAMNEGKVPVIIMRGTTLADGRYSALYLLQKENLEGLMHISSNPKWEDVQWLEHVIDLYYPHFEDAESCEGMNIFDSVEEAEEFIKQFDDEVGCLNYTLNANSILKAYWDNWQHSSEYSDDYFVPSATGRFKQVQDLDAATSKEGIDFLRKNNIDSLYELACYLLANNYHLEGILEDYLSRIETQEVIIN